MSDSLLFILGLSLLYVLTALVAFGFPYCEYRRSVSKGRTLGGLVEYIDRKYSLDYLFFLVFPLYIVMTAMPARVEKAVMGYLENVYNRYIRNIKI